MALRHINSQPGPDEVRFHFLGERSTLLEALSHEHKVIEEGEQPNAPLLQYITNSRIILEKIQGAVDNPNGGQLYT